MNMVYEAAQLTIVAATGDCSSYGLPGVSFATQVWKSEKGAKKSYKDRLEFSAGGDILLYLFASRYRINRENLWSIINNYSTRSLSHESDTLNGILGIFRFFSRRNTNPIHNLWGIPFQLQATDNTENTRVAKQFLSGLVWDIIEPSRRKEGFPSWLWAGWTNEAESCYVHVLSSNIAIAIELRNGDRQTWKEFTTMLPTADIRMFSVYLHITAQTVRLRISYSAEGYPYW
ncbi:hypothetical protein NA56DRAFT_738028 [Hyaloscypha hepaticicola]|uniref:Heterokaryon incompatibility domain-containing protein n=1 Tax=Hyaloscypha hepaticicola TaxID=2082293 RepID=A0A2J6QGJ7_9HELO|nr:hypothetical protein NA56DRAFT_738028 [Hyaloscypha hepaticicola]